MLSRRSVLIASAPFIAAPAVAHAEETAEPQIALMEPGAYMVAASPAEAVRHNVVEMPHLLKSQNPSYPEDAERTWKEGWVQFTTKITDLGTVADPAVWESYPPAVFDKTALNAFRNFQFTPGTVNHQPRVTCNYRFNMFFSIIEYRGITSANYDTFDKLREKLKKGQIDAAMAALTDLQHRYDAGKLNLSEVARMNDFSARLAILRKEFIAAKEANSRTLALGAFLDRPAALQDAQRILILICIGLGRTDQAVDYYDAYVKTYPQPLPSEAEVIEKLRALGYGKGVRYDVKPYAELTRRGSSGSNPRKS